ncbi:MAG: hypothetical protein K6F28_06295 [Lachnospiraceae bacterium]|nr:hypothetical protein [Lachnospiraceae bacterium]
MNKVTMNMEGTIVVGNVEVKYDSWAYDHENKQYTFTAKAGTPDLSSLNGKDCYIGVNIDYQGIPYYQAQMNEWVRSFAQAMNGIEISAQDEYGKQAQVLFTSGSDENKFAGYDYDSGCDIPAVNQMTYFNSTSDNYLQLTAGNFNINTDMVKDVNLFGTTKDITQGQDAQDITQLLMEVRTDKSKMTYRGCSAEEFLQCLTSDVALGAKSANNFYSNFDKISRAIVGQRTSVSGVDNDEEALNLVKFQEAYNLSSKMIQIMTEIYDRLILQTGV